jgi:hypothetical protein
VPRLFLEFAGYAALIANDPTLALTWFDRDTDRKAKQRVRNEFQGGKIKGCRHEIGPDSLGRL